MKYLPGAAVSAVMILTAYKLGFIKLDNKMQKHLDEKRAKRAAMRTRLVSNPAEMNDEFESITAALS